MRRADVRHQLGLAVPGLVLTALLACFADMVPCQLAFFVKPRLDEKGSDLPWSEGLTGRGCGKKVGGLGVVLERGGGRRLLGNLESE